MIELIKTASKSIINTDYGELTYALITLSGMSIVVFGVITGFCYFITAPEDIGIFIHIAPPGDKIWLIVFISTIISIVFGIFTLFADSHYAVNDDRRFLVAIYFWIFTTCSGTLPMILPFILLYDLIKYLFCVFNFCLEHLFMLFAPRKTKEKMIVPEKTEKEMINTYNNFLKN